MKTERQFQFMCYDAAEPYNTKQGNATFDELKYLVPEKLYKLFKAFTEDGVSVVNVSLTVDSERWNIKRLTTQKS